MIPSNGRNASEMEHALDWSHDVLDIADDIGLGGAECKFHRIEQQDAGSCREYNGQNRQHNCGTFFFVHSSVPLLLEF